MKQEREQMSKATKKMLTVAGLFLVGLILILVTNFIFAPMYESLGTELAATATIGKRIAAVEEQTKVYEERLLESGKIYGNLITEKESYISNLGQITIENNLDINKMTVEDIKKTGEQMYSMCVEVELQGNLQDVKEFIKDLYESKTISRIDSFSYRLKDSQQFQWMWREIDDRQLVSWWDESLSNQNMTSVNEDHAHILNADDLLAHGTALCYLRIEFLGAYGD